MVDTCIDLRMDELEHAQMLVLKLTEFITQVAEGPNAVNTDDGGSVFGPGELTANAGDKTEEDTDPIDP
ncbi:MAG: hypothetical protein IKJ99_03515 [Oscillospiraceae bacterium]|nr:hypothetical protein [Oscillospiraceae bacterium]